MVERTTKRNRKIALVASLAICCAVLLRIVGKLGIATTPVGIARSLIYIALYAWWGMTANRRILQTQVRHALVAVSLLCIFWFVVRSLKYFFVTDPTAVRYLWYLYYFPMLFIPLLAVFVSLALGKPENYRLPQWARFLYVPTIALVLLVLTNDVHQLVFAFPAEEPWGDKDYEYAAGYYAVFGWEVLCALVAFGIMLAKCRLAQKKKYLPALLLGAAVAYAAIYASGAEWMQLVGGDITAVQCLLFVGIFESCIACGLIQTNTGYEELFMVSRLGAQIENKDGEICLTSSNARNLDPDQRAVVATKPIMIDGATLFKSKPIRFGRVLWQEDVAELVEAIEQIEENCQNLAERNRIHRENLETQRKILSLQEKNRAIDLLTNETAGQIEYIDKLLECYDKQENAQSRQKLLAGVAVVGAYVKRYGNLLLTSDRVSKADASDLTRCFEDSFVNLELLGVDCLCTLPAHTTMRTKDMLRVYRTFELVLEHCLFDIHAVWVNAREKRDTMLLTIDFVCDVDVSGCGETADSFFFDDGCSRFTFQLKNAGGDCGDYCDCGCGAVDKAGADAVIGANSDSGASGAASDGGADDGACEGGTTK